MFHFNGNEKLRKKVKPILSLFPQTDFYFATFLKIKIRNICKSHVCLAK